MIKSTSGKGMEFYVEVKYILFGLVFAISSSLEPVASFWKFINIFSAWCQRSVSWVRRTDLGVGGLKLIYINLVHSQQPLKGKELAETESCRNIHVNPRGMPHGCSHVDQWPGTSDIHKFMHPSSQPRHLLLGHEHTVSQPAVWHTVYSFPLWHWWGGTRKDPSSH